MLLRVIDKGILLPLESLICRCCVEQSALASKRTQFLEKDVRELRTLNQVWSFATFLRHVRNDGAETDGINHEHKRMEYNEGGMTFPEGTLAAYFLDFLL